MDKTIITLQDSTELAFTTDQILIAAFAALALLTILCIALYNMGGDKGFAQARQRYTNMSNRGFRRMKREMR